MSTLRYTDGSVTVTLDGGMEEFVRRALDAAGGEAVRILSAASEDLAATAREAWYGPGNVTRRTGRSGDVQVVTTVSDEEVRIRVGSTDLAKAKYVHRPGVFATTVEEVSADVYAEAKRKGGAIADTYFHAQRSKRERGVVAGKYYRVASSPLASDGKYLLPELVTKPVRRRIRELTPELGRAIATKAGGARG